MRKLWGFPVKDLGWEHENGKPFDPDAVYPVVDVIGNRVYTIDRKDESDVSVFHSYGIKSQPGAALNFALTAWGNPATWERPDISSRIVACLGTPVCTTCVEVGEAATIGLANEWRLQPMNDNDIRLNARQLVDAGDPVREHLSDSHTLAELDTFTDDNRKELFRRAIILFGAPYDLATVTPSDPMITVLNMLPKAIDPRVAVHLNREKDSKQDIYSPLNRLHD